LVSSSGGSRYYVTFIDDATKKLGFIVFEINMIYLIFPRRGNIWLKMREEKCQSVSYLIVKVNIATNILISIVQSIEFVERRQL